METIRKLKSSNRLGRTTEELRYKEAVVNYHNALADLIQIVPLLQNQSE